MLFLRTMSSTGRMSTSSYIPRSSSSSTAMIFGKQQSKKYMLSTTTNTVPFRQWPTKFVESNGDYRNESWIEEYVGGPLYEKQNTLPKLPVIDNIETSIQRLVPTVIPLIKSLDEKDSFYNAIEKFPYQAQKLQERLQQRSIEYSTNSSWLQQWWNQLGYLQVRDSNVINVSFFFHFKDDATIFTTNNKSSSSSVSTASTATANVKRAASIITSLGQYRQLVCTGQLPAEFVGKGDKKTYLCSTAFKHMFNTTRIPKHYQDSVKLYDPSQYNHCIIIRNGLYYSLDFCNKHDGTPYSIDVLENGIQEIISTADSIDSNDVIKLGYMTGINRDNAATLREKLLLVGGNEISNSLEVLQSGAFVVCLDNVMPVTREQCGNMLLHGNGGGTNSKDDGVAQGYNRWFDKSIQIIIANNGKTGLCGEHSMMDGMPQLGLANHITKTTYQSCVELSSSLSSSSTSDQKTNVKEIFSKSLLQKINTTTETHQLLNDAKAEFDQLVLQNSLKVQCFHGYGSDFMKQNGFSPDAYVQMIMQLATYRLWGEQVGTYESTQVRPFLHGRTETTRTVSVESSKFIKRFGLLPLQDEHDSTARKEKIQLLQDAVSAHVKYIGLAAKGQGVDRHFFGMSMLVDDNEQVPDLYNDPVFQRSKRWRVSTSHLTHAQFDGWGYGQVVPDGVGLAYSIHSRYCLFTITALKHTQWTEKLSQLLEEALIEVRTVLEIEKASTTNTTPQSKL